jgi:hypothetical protein
MAMVEPDCKEEFESLELQVPVGHRVWESRDAAKEAD